MHEEMSTNKSENFLESDRRFQAEKIAVATRLVERCEAGEVFQFPGLHPERYAAMKRDFEEDPNYAQDIDELIVRFQSEGMKVVFGDVPTSGNVFCLPANSDDVVNDSLLPRQLLARDISDRMLRDLVSMEFFHHEHKQ